MIPRSSNIRRNDAEPKLGPLIAVSVIFHVALLGLFMTVQTMESANAAERPKAVMFNLEVADTLGTGVGGVPKKGPAHDGKIKLPEPEPEQPPPTPVPTINTGEPKIKKKTNVKESPRTPRPSNVLREAINEINQGREGEYTRPDGDPNSLNPGPPGPPGGDTCALYRNRASRYIRKSGNVPEAVGKSVRISVSIGASGAVTGKHITQSSGVPTADSVALGLVPGSFQAPPPECGSLSLRVTVRFMGASSPKLPPREEHPVARKSSVPSDIDRAMQDIKK